MNLAYGVGALVLVSLTLGASMEGVSPAKAQEGADPLAELLALGDTAALAQEEGGGSIRAKRAVDTTAENRRRAPENIEGKVEAVSTARFPLVAVTVKVTKPAKSGAGKGQKPNTTLVLVPKLAVEGSNVNMQDASTLVNAGAFYLQRGDKVVFQLGPQKGKAWEASYIERR